MHVLFNDDVYQKDQTLPKWTASNVTIDTITVAYLKGSEEHEAVYTSPTEVTVSGANPQQVASVKNAGPNVEVTISNFNLNKTRRVKLFACDAGTTNPKPVYMQWMSNRKWDIRKVEVSAGTCNDYIVDPNNGQLGPAQACSGPLTFPSKLVKDIEIHTK